VVEIGVNIGSCTLEMAALPPYKKVYAFEPNPQHFSLLVKSLEKNSLLGDVIPLPFGASDRKTREQITVERSNKGNGMVGNLSQLKDAFPFKNGTYDSLEIKLVPLDNIVKERVHLLKIDSQGHDLFVLLGGKRLLTEYGIEVITLEYWPSVMAAKGQRGMDLLLLLDSYQYVLYEYTQAGTQQLVTRNQFQRLTEELLRTKNSRDLIAYNHTLQL
jgi:FkbM family methyltransferase